MPEIDDCEAGVRVLWCVGGSGYKVHGCMGGGGYLGLFIYHCTAGSHSEPSGLGNNNTEVAWEQNDMYGTAKTRSGHVGE